MTVQTLLTRTQNTILSAAFIISLSSGLSALLGLVKNRLLANYFGVSKDLAIFYTSDTIPSLVYSVLIVGAVSTVFIPIFTGLLKKDEKEAFHVASTIINATILFFLVAGALIFIFAPGIFNALSLGKFQESEIILGAKLMRIMIGAQMVLVIGSLVTSVLQSFKYFLVPAFAPVVYNAGMILGIVFLSKPLGIYGPAIGVLIGAVFHMLIQLPLLRHTKFNYAFTIDSKDKEFKRTISLIPPRILSVLLASGIQTINNSLAILISTASVVTLRFANQLQGFPVNLFGFSIAAAALPTLSGLSDKDNSENFKKTFITSLHQMLYLVVPLSMILFTLRIPVVRLVYGVSNFPWAATLETAKVLAIFSISIFSQSANYLITRSFHALKDTLTPVLVSLATAVINIGLSVYLVVVMKCGVWAVALSFSLTSFIDTLVLLYLLDKKVGGFGLKKLTLPFLKISASALLMGLTLYFPIKLLDKVIFDTTRTINLILLTGIAFLCGATTYFLFTKLLKVEEVQLLYKLIRKLTPTKKEIVSGIPPYTETTIG